MGKRAFIVKGKQTEPHEEPKPSLCASSEEQIKQLTFPRTADGMGSPCDTPPGQQKGFGLHLAPLGKGPARSSTWPDPAEHVNLPPRGKKKN